MIITDKNISPNPNTDSNSGEYDSLMKESKEWAKEVGMKQSDIDEAVKSVRNNKNKKGLT